MSSEQENSSDQICFCHQNATFAYHVDSTSAWEDLCFWIWSKSLQPLITMISTLSNHCDGGDGLLDLDVHSLENSRAGRHRLHHSQKTEADLSPLVSRRQFNCKWNINVQRQVPSPDRSHIRVRQLQRVLLQMVDRHQLPRPFHHVHLLLPQSTKVISYLV